MPRPVTKQKTSVEYDTILAEYKQRYNVDTLDSPNDLANLRQMIRNQILINKLQDNIEVQSSEDATALKKLLDSIVALSEININLERTLGIDRKTRKNDTSESVADYLQDLNVRAKEFVNDPKRLMRVMCRECKILVGRISGVYDSTSFSAAFQCPQCKKYATIDRKEQDIFYGVKDAEWRRKYPIEIIQSKRSKTLEIENTPNEFDIGGENNESETETI